MHELEILCESLDYMSKEDIAVVRDAFDFADNAHKGQTRRSGEPYIIHPLWIARILSGFEPDRATILAALLHDVVEDTGATAEQLEHRFGSEVAHIVEGVSKLVNFKSDNYRVAQAENFQKMALAMIDDIRVILVKLADRLHNMRTLHHLRPDKQRRIALETLHVYAPIASRLGMDTFYRELEDLSFKVIFPMRFSMIEKAVNKARQRNKDYVEEIRTTFEQMLINCAIEGRVEGRRKHLAGIYFKMSGKAVDKDDPYSQLVNEQRKRVSFRDIMDIHGFRIITDSVDSCYRLLGQVHRVYKPYPNRFKDYIAIPKANGYQSLHTTVMGARGYPIEVQIRTNEMHQTAETGLASHWLYKNRDQSGSGYFDPEYKLWRQGLITMKNQADDSQEFLHNVKVDLFPSDVYVFSPNGEIFPLPRGATPVDFAYAVHTDVGNHCAGCEINGVAMPLSTQLQNGQTVRIITQEGARPSPSWRDFVVTAKALSGMGYFFRQLRESEAIRLGTQLLNRVLSRYRTSLLKVRNEQIERFLEVEGYGSLDELLERIGTGKLYADAVANRLISDLEELADQDIQPLTINEDNWTTITFSTCCRPVKGDHITAHIRTDMGIAVHRNGCNNIKGLRKRLGQSLPGAWDSDAVITLPVRLKVEATNDRELIAPIADTITSSGGIIRAMENTGRDIHLQTIVFTLLVESRYHLSTIIRRLRRLADIRQATRA